MKTNVKKIVFDPYFPFHSKYSGRTVNTRTSAVLPRVLFAKDV